MIGSVFLLLYHTLLLLVRVLVEDKGDCSIPGGFQHLVSQALLVKAVVPLGKVTGTVQVIWRRPNLSTVYTAATAKPNTATKGGNRGLFNIHTVHDGQTLSLYDKIKTSGNQMYQLFVHKKHA